MRSRVVIGSVALALGWAAVACGPAAPGDRSQVVARIGGREITLEALRARAAGTPGDTQRLERPGGAQRTLEEMIEGLLLEEELHRTGLDQDPDFVRRLAGIHGLVEREEQQLRRRTLLDRLKQEVEIDEQELRARYEQTADRFRTTRIHLRMISDPDEARVREALARVAAGEAFDEVASEVNADPGLRQSGGDLGMRERPAVPAVLRVRAFALTEPGAVSDAFLANGLWTALQLVERKDGVVRDFESVRAQLELESRQRRASELYQERLAALRSELGVHVEEERLTALSPPPDELPRPAPAPDPRVRPGGPRPRPEGAPPPPAH